MIHKPFTKRIRQLSIPIKSVQIEKTNIKTKSIDIKPITDDCKLKYKNLHCLNLNCHLINYPDKSNKNVLDIKNKSYKNFLKTNYFLKKK